MHTPRLAVRRAFCPSVLLILLFGADNAAAQKNLSQPLSTTALAGQQVAVLPLTLVIADPSLPTDSTAVPGDRRVALAWADSAIGDAFDGRAPEVDWILPPELRQIARRGAGFVSDPDRMGQAIMRAPNLNKVPDPLRSSLRKLVALAGGRYAVIPAALAFACDTAGVRAELSVVVADSRNGSVLWRSLAVGTGPAPAAALSVALATVLPVEFGS